MVTLLATIALTALTVSGPAAASQTFNPGPYSSRGDCEAHRATLRSDDRDSLLDRFPQIFSTPAEVSSFISRAFSCERSAPDGKWYLVDRRLEVINSEWFQSRLP